MFRSLNSRLLLSYILVILVCLILVGLGLFLFVRASPLWTSAAVIRLEEAERATMRLLVQAGPLGTISQDRLHDLLDQAARDREARILLLDDAGLVQYDSERAWVGQGLPDVFRQPAPRLPRIQGSFTGPDGQRWLFIGQVLSTGDRQRMALLFASRPMRVLLLLWFVDNLLPPMGQAGLAALLLSIPLAWLVARSIARPLQRVAAAAGAIAQGDLEQRAPVSGPREVQELARAFNRMADRVAAAQQAQRDLVANVSHELKTPLTSVQGFSQAILDGTATEPEAIERAARVIQEEAERMRRMVDEILNLARFDADQVQMAREPVEIGPLLASCAERLAPQAEAAGNRLQVQAEEGLFVTGDADWLTQALVNLLDNGLRHTQGGRVEAVAQREGDWVTVTVTDTGEGIPAADLPRIFERFYQADKSRRRRSGVGLGLSIAREVVQRHGGEIKAESVLGVGSRFTVLLPARGSSREGGLTHHRGTRVSRGGGA